VAQLQLRRQQRDHRELQLLLVRHGVGEPGDSFRGGNRSARMFMRVTRRARVDTLCAGPFGVLLEGSQGMRNSWILAVTAALFPACAIPTTGSTVRSDAPGAAVAAQAQPAAQETAWDFNATIIEACSCPMFCQCYFNTQPADHPGCCPPNSDPKAP